MIPDEAVDELALELFIGDNFNQAREQSIEDWQHFHAMNKYYRGVEHYKAMAGHVLAIGYRKETK
jgi:hypothetical protein